MLPIVPQCFLLSIWPPEMGCITVHYLFLKDMGVLVVSKCFCLAKTHTIHIMSDNMLYMFRQITLAVHRKAWFLWSLFSIYRFCVVMQRVVPWIPPIATLVALLQHTLFLNEEQEFSSETKPNPKRTWRRWGGVFSHERSRCFHLPVFKRKKKAESVLGWRKIHDVKEWGGRAVIGSSHRCDVCGREMKSWSQITVVLVFLFFFLLDSVSTHVRKAARAWLALERTRCSVSVKISSFF